MNMACFRTKFFNLVCVSLYIALLPNFVMAATDYPSLTMHGEVYKNSCSPEQKAVLREKLSKANVPDADKAWQAIELILCVSDSQASRREVLALFYKKVNEKFESTAGRPGRQTVTRNEVFAKNIMAAGKSWETEIIAKNEIIIVQYFVNEACVKSVAFLHNNAKWSIYEVGQACD